MQTLTNGVQYNIIRGPDKWLLLAQLQDICRITFCNRPTIRFKVKLSDDVICVDDVIYVEALVNGIQSEDGSGCVWNISGYIPASQQLFVGVYNTRYRTGKIEFN